MSLEGFLDSFGYMAAISSIVDKAMSAAQRFGHDDDWDDEFQDEWDGLILEALQAIKAEVDEWL